MSLTDKDERGGDEPISSLELVVTPESLAERDSSVLWHRLFSQVGESPPFFLVVDYGSIKCSHPLLVVLVLRRSETAGE